MNNKIKSFFNGISVREMFSTRKLVHTALFVSLGIILPLAFHAVPRAGAIFLPMHIPVLLCGIICGFPLGLLCGIMTPILSSMLTSMPATAMLPSMICELAVYGTVIAAMWRFLPVKNFYVKTYASLIGAMLCGRATYGILNALIFKAGNYSASIWLTAAFATSLPGILIQLVAIPAILIALHKARLFDFNIKPKEKPADTQTSENGEPDEVGVLPK